MLANTTPDIRIIVMTHHHAINYDASMMNTSDTSGMAQDIYNALGGKNPDYWYYGHLHNGIVYNAAQLESSGIYTPGKAPNLRCFGHAAIPFGNAYGLMNNKAVDYFTQTVMPDPDDRQKNRVVNGFAMITLTPDGNITEDVYEVANAPTGGGIATLAWSNVTPLPQQIAFP